VITLSRAEKLRIVGIKRIAIVLLAGIAIVMIPGNLVSGQVFYIGMQQTGSIGVSSVPYQTTISLDNRQVGVTPAVLNGISPGTHTVLLTSPGYLPYSQQVMVSAGAVARVYAVLIQKPPEIPFSGTVVASSTPSSANIYLDNRLVGVTPATIGGVSAGQHLVTFSKPGYNPYDAQITVSNGTTTDVNTVLIPSQATALALGSIHIVSTPSFASVWLDNRLTGVTPETIAGVTPGQHQLKISKPGYIGTTRNVSVIDHQVTEITVVLPVNPRIYF
jgi:hypothetical protein